MKSPAIKCLMPEGMYCCRDSLTLIHLVFGGFRPDEFIWRLNGDSYMSIMERGGGIINTVRATREASFEELKHKAEWFLDTMSRMGVTTVEGKSGYGLDRDTELNGEHTHSVEWCT